MADTESNEPKTQKSKAEVGLYPKYEITRIAPSSTGKDHSECQYFVLDLTHDPMARKAALVYALMADEDGYHQLATDLRIKVHELNTQAKLEKLKEAL